MGDKIIRIESNLEKALFLLPDYQFEKNYPEELRMTLKQTFEYFFKFPEIICMGYFRNLNLIAERKGMPLKQMYKGFEEYVENHDKYIKRKTLYVNSFTVNKKYRGQGIGLKLADAFKNYVKEKGYEIIIGHATKGSSITVNQKLGAKIIKPYENWYGSTETVYLYELNL